jgi:SAM-dependent methyltransferase
MADSTTTANEAEHRRWNSDYWTSVWPRREQFTSVVTAPLLGHLSLRPGDRVLDVGSGGGTSSLAAAPLVGSDGAVVGADISEQLVQFARRRAAEAGLANVTFEMADMQTDHVGGALFTVAMSQFGVMFFDEPWAAFANLLHHLEDGGRLGFACWQSAARNPWHIQHAIKPYLPPPPPPAPGKSAGGPFSLGDAIKTAELLSSSGWAHVECFPYDVTVNVGSDAIVDAGQPAFMGVPDNQLAEAQAAVQRHLAQFDQGDGRYRVPLAYQIFTASKLPE